MASIEDKILGDKRDNYCSSSEDEDEGNNGFQPANDILPSSSRCPTKSVGPSKNTGPKGVLQDWQLFQQHEKQLRQDKEQQLVTLCKKTALTCLSEREQALMDSATAAEDDDIDNLLSDESLADFIKQRMENMIKQQTEQQKGQNFGQVFNLSTCDEYLQVIENTNVEITIIIHIYEERIAECIKMNDCLISICQDYPFVKFCKIQASKVGMSLLFKQQGIPALLVYKGGELIGNFVGLKEEFGAEFYSGDVENYLIEHGVLRDQHNIPKLLKPKN